MISAVESVAIRTEGQVELESTSRDAYAKVLILAVGSFLGDAAFKLKKHKNEKNSFTSFNFSKTSNS